MSTNNFKYETLFSAQWTGQGAVSQATDAVKRYNLSLKQTTTDASGAAHTQEYLSATVSNTKVKLDDADAAARRMSQGLMAVRGALFGVQMTLFISSMYVSNMMTMEMATNQVETATERLTRMQREGQRGTEEYRNAVRQLENAQLNLQRAQTMTSIMTLSMGLQVVSMTVSIAQAIPQLTKLTATLRTYAATAALAKSTTLIGAASLAAGLAVGAGAYYAIENMGKSSAPQQTVDVNINTQTDNTYAAFARQDRNKINSIGR